MSAVLRTRNGRRDALLLLGILLLAALVRLPGIESRGTWEDDQGQQMLAVQQWLATGSAPLLGPPLSIGDVHHGVATYWLFLPAAAISGSDPVAVTAWIALLGIAAVAAVWGLARTVGGVAAGHAAGLIAALSPTWIEASTFIWNANLVGPAASFALLGAWRAWETGRARWWLVAGFAAITLVHAHLLASLLVPPLAALAVMDLARRHGRGRRRLAGALAIVGVAFVLSLIPFAIHEATTDFAEARAFLAYLTSRAANGTADLTTATQPLLARLGIVTWRAASWPITGLVSAAPVASAFATAVVAFLLGWRAAASFQPERTFVRWTIAAVAFMVSLLTILVPSLGTIVPGIPNDHYHTFFDPLVITVVALAIAAGWQADATWPASVERAARRLRSNPTPGMAAAVMATVLTVALGIGALPPASPPDGGWPQTRDAVAHIRTLAGDATIRVEAAADFKTGDSVRLPLVLSGARVAGMSGVPADEPAGALVIVCDPLFSDAMGAACGGAAEDARLVELGLDAGGRDAFAAWRLVERFEAGPRRTISVYAP